MNICRLKDYNNILSRKLIYILSFFVPLFIMLIIYILKGIYPFGDRAFLRMDLYHQYLPFHSELQYKLKNLGSLLYTYDVGLGSNFLTLFAYYLSSPFNIILLFTSSKYIVDIMGYICIIKIALSGLTFSYFLIEKFKVNSPLVLYFSLFYALSGYTAAYYWNIMWLDNIVLLPLLILGFEELFYKNEGKIYIITLALSIICNYYIATMSCFFLIIYFIYLLFITNQKSIINILYKLINILIPTIIAILISSILLIPIFYAFQTTASSELSMPKSIYEFFSIFGAMSRHMPIVEIENGTDQWPNIYCGIFIIPLIIYYFLSKKISFKIKTFSLILLLIFYAAFTINIFNFASHIFRYPNSLPSRFSFIYIAILLTLGFNGVYKLIDKNLIIKSIFGSIGLIFLIQALVDKTETKSYVLAVTYLIIYMIILFYGLNKKFSKRILYFIFLILFCIEAFINIYVTSITTVSRSDYLKNRDETILLKNYVKEINNDFYRIEIDKRKTKDDGALLNYPSASIFSSSCYKDGMDLYEKWGMEASMNAYSVNGATPLTYALLGVKYMLVDHKIDDENLYNMRLIKSEKNMSLYENLDTMPLSYVLNDQFLEKYEFGSGNAATALNNISRSFGEKVVLEPIDINVDGIDAKFKVKEEGRYFAVLLDTNIDDVIFQHGDTSTSFSNAKRGYFLDLGLLNTNEEYVLTNDTTTRDIQVQVFRFNIKSMKSLIDKIKSDSDMHMRGFNDTYINYGINVKNKGKIILTLPYDKGWKVEVDGKIVNTEKVLDFFLAFDGEEGSHTIVARYTPPGFKMGLIFTICGIILMVAYFNRRRLLL